MNVDECGDRLDLTALLCMVDKVTLAGLVFGVPFENVKLDADGKRTAPDRDAWSRLVRTWGLLAWAR